MRVAEVRLAGGTARYAVAGTGPPLVLVHGLSGSGRWWTRNIGALSRRHRVHLIDLPGFGRLRRRWRFVLGEAAAWVAEWMAAVGLERAHLMGHSMGGGICLQLAARVPHLIDRLVLVAPTGVPWGRSPVAHAGALAREALTLPPPFAPVLALDALGAGPRAVLGAAREVMALDLREEMARVRAPTLLVWGERDVLVPAGMAAEMERRIPDARSVVIRGTGHVPMFARPREFNRHVLTFLGPPGR